MTTESFMEMSGDMRFGGFSNLKYNIPMFQIDDHNVPSLEQMLELVRDVREWLQGGEGRKRVVALHCKGGKGRTGTMICAILIDKGLFKVNVLNLNSYPTAKKTRKLETLFSTLGSGGLT